MKKFLLLLLFLNVLRLQAQKNDCLSDFEFLVKKIKNDYPGYDQKVTNENRNKLLVLEKSIRLKIVAHPDSCYSYLNEYTSYFRDLHLRVKKSSNDNILVNKDSDNLVDIIANLNYDSLKMATINSSGIEGIWRTYSEKFAVIKRSDGNYVGVALNIYGFKKNQLMWKFVKEGENSFKVTECTKENCNRTFDYIASLHLKGKVLEIHEYSKYVRVTDSEAYNIALLSSYIPFYPNGTNTYPVALNISDSTFYLRLPNFYGKTTETLVKKYWCEIISKPNLIIDIRNNGGGLDEYYQILLKLLYTKPYESKGVEWYASEGNIKIFEDALEKGEVRNGEEGVIWIKELLKEMNAHKGKFVIHPQMGGDVIITRDTILKYPRKIGIIINENNASSAEQFLLAAKNSDKVILFGNKNTAGVLDYSNADQIYFPSGNYSLIYPMTRSRRLPEHPIDNVGIAPDIIIPLNETVQLFDRIDDWVYFVKNYLEFKEK